MNTKLKLPDSNQANEEKEKKQQRKKNGCWIFSSADLASDWLSHFMATAWYPACP